MKYKVGDKVKIKENLIVGKTYGGLYLHDGAGKHIGEETLVTKVERERYRLGVDNSSRIWTGEYAGKYDAIQECMKAVEEQPIAYDTNKVVERLESIKEKGACAEEDCGNCKYFKTCWDGEMSYKLALDKAIETIKDGGRDEE